MIDHRLGHTATLLPSDDILVSGGRADLFTLDSAELYKPTPK